MLGLEISGKENLKEIEGESVIFAGNHCSLLDGSISGVALAFSISQLKVNNFFQPVRYLVYNRFFNFFSFKKPFYFPISFVIATFLFLGDFIPIKERDKNNYNKIGLDFILKKGILTLRNGGFLFIFPEGKMSEDGKLNRGKSGVAFLHKETNAPIIPIGIKGTYKMFSWRNLLKDRDEKKVVVNFGKPIYSLWEENEEKNLFLGADKVMSEIAKLI